jgi:hypothetical protein
MTTDINHHYTLTPPLMLNVKKPVTPPPTLYVAQKLHAYASNCSCSFSVPSSLPPHSNYSFVSLPALLQMQVEAHYNTTTDVNHPYTLTQPLPTATERQTTCNTATNAVRCTTALPLCCQLFPRIATVPYSTTRPTPC